MNDELQNALLEWMRRREVEDEADREKFIRQYPEIADELRTHIEDEQWLKNQLVPANATSNRAALDRNSSTASMEAKPDGAAGSARQRQELPKAVGRYEVKTVLGSGTSGTVYLAWDPLLEREVAVKVLDAVDPQEAQILASLSHDNIVTVHDVEISDDACYIVSEYLAGKSLKDRIAAGNWSWEDISKLIATIAGALHYLHQNGIYHRDIKPSNIMFSETGRPMLVDFGFALTREQVGRLMSSAGTPLYMSPEQLGGVSVDGRSDIFSLGVVFYELLTGERPSVENRLNRILGVESDDLIPPREYKDSIPRKLEEICMKCLAESKANRYQTAVDLARDLRAYLKPWYLRKTWIVAAVAALVLLVVVALNPLRNPQPTVDTAWQTNDQDASIAPETPVRIESVEIKHLEDAGENDIDRGLIGEGSYSVLADDGAKLRAYLSRPAYCYWIAFRADGKDEICFPNNSEEVPERTDRPAYPSENSNESFGFTDGSGLHAFALVVSSQPLPTYAEWRRQRGTIPWSKGLKAQSGAVYRHDGTWLDTLTPTSRLRDKGRAAKGTQQHIQRLFEWLTEADNIDDVQVWSFVVKERVEP